MVLVLPIGRVEGLFAHSNKRLFVKMRRSSVLQSHATGGTRTENRGAPKTRNPTTTDPTRLYLGPPIEWLGPLHSVAFPVELLETLPAFH